MPRESERVIHKAVVDHLKMRARPGVFYFHPANGGYRRPSEAKALAGLGVVAGVPDLIIIRNGVAYCLEIKSEGGRLSPAQRQCHEALRAAGAVVEVAVGIDEALALLEGWGLLRGKAGIRSPITGLSAAATTAAIQ